jgi:hypothetical protein
MAETTPRGGPGAKLQKGTSADIDPTNPYGAAPTGPVAPVSTTRGSSSSSSKTKPTTYNKKASDALLEQQLLDALNIIPTAKMKAEFFKGLNAFLKAYGSTSSSKSTAKGSTSTSIQGADAAVYVSQFVKEIIKDKLKKNPKAELGGLVGDNIRTLRNYAADMGVFKSDNDIISKSADIVTGANRQEDVLASYRKDAQALYVNFASRLKEDTSLTVRDLANPYLEMMADTFEGLSSNIKLTDDTIQKAINDAKGLMNLGEFRTMLRRDQRFNVTGTAKREAASLATGMLRSMKFGA